LAATKYFIGWSPQRNNIMHVLALDLPIVGPFTALLVYRPAVYGGLTGNPEHLPQPCSQGFSL
jgi:hypothetical protein